MKQLIENKGKERILMAPHGRVLGHLQCPLVCLNPKSDTLHPEFVTATLRETESLVSDRKQTTGPLCDRNTLPYFHFHRFFAFRPRDAHNRPVHKYFRVCTTINYSPITSHRTSNRNQGILEIDLSCCKQSPLIFSNRNKLRPPPSCRFAFSVHVTAAFMLAAWPFMPMNWRPSRA